MLHLNGKTNLIYGYIYKITNLINNKIYIGQTTESINKRWIRHCQRNSNCTYLGRAIQKYGKENFSIEEIDNAIDFQELNSKEEQWIKYFKTLDINYGYNIRSGGANPKHSEETKKKIGDSNRGKTLPKLSDDRKKAISLRTSGKNNPMYGSIMPEEHKQKLIAINQNRKGTWKRSDENKQKIRNTLLGQKHSEDRKQKIKESWIKRKEKFGPSGRNEE